MHSLLALNLADTMISVSNVKVSFCFIKTEVKFLYEGT